MLDVLRVLRMMAKNSAKLAKHHKCEVEEQMKDINGMLYDMKHRISNFEKKGWLKRMWALHKSTKTLMKLDTQLRRSVGTLMQLYQLASDADVREQFLDHRQYILEAAIEEQVQKRMRERGESEKAAISSSQEDSQAVGEVAVRARLSPEQIHQEMAEFRDEVRQSPLLC